jgi:hypothetical protein
LKFREGFGARVEDVGAVHAFRTEDAFFVYVVINQVMGQ